MTAYMMRRLVLLLASLLLLCTCGQGQVSEQDKIHAMWEKVQRDYARRLPPKTPRGHAELESLPVYGPHRFLRSSDLDPKASTQQLYNERMTTLAILIKRCQKEHPSYESNSASVFCHMQANRKVMAMQRGLMLSEKTEHLIIQPLWKEALLFAAFALLGLLFSAWRWKGWTGMALAATAHRFVLGLKNLLKRTPLLRQNPVLRTMLSILIFLSVAWSLVFFGMGGDGFGILLGGMGK